MNKAYRSVWNESSGTWVAAPECARGKGKGKRGEKREIATIVKTLAAIGMTGLALSAHADEPAVDDPPVAAAGVANAQALLENVISSQNGESATGRTSGSGVDVTGLTRIYDSAAYYSRVAGLADGCCSAPSDVARAAGTGSIAIGSNAYSTGTAATALGVQAYAPANDSVAIGSGSVANQADTVSVGNDGTTSYTAYDAKGKAYTIRNQANTRRIVNLAAGKDGTDASNIGQLRSAGIGIDSAGNVTNALVAYDDRSASTVTLAGVGGTRITNLAAGAVSAASRDAVNGAQLFGVASGTAAALGGGASVSADGSLKTPSYRVGGNTYTDVGHALTALESVASTGSTDSVQYDSADHKRVTFDGGTNSTVLSNVAAGSADRDAANVGQLRTAGVDIDKSGNVTNALVAYDDRSASAITLAGVGGTRIMNVAAGSVSAASRDAVNGAQLFGVASGTASALGGGVAVNSDGTLTAPSYRVGGNTYTDVGRALNALESVASTGSTDSVQYDAADHKSVTFDGGPNGTALSNVAAGAADRDASNVGQLRAAGVNVDNTGNVTNALVAYDDRTQAAVKLGGLDGTRIANLAAGTVSAGSRDAVNGAQLFSVAGGAASALGGGATVNPDGSITSPSYRVGGNTYGDVGHALDALETVATTASADSVQYDSKDHARVTFDGANSTLLTNVAAGAADRDAANVGQLRAAGLNIDSSGNLMNTVVAYDNRTQSTITLGGVDGTRIANLSAGAVSAASRDAVNGAQLFGVASGTAAALGGGTSVNADGSLSSPTYRIAGNAYTDVGHALKALETVASTASADSVQYDSKDHSRVTFDGGANATVLSNVAAGAADRDAVNVAQLKAAGLGFDKGGKLTNAFVAYDDLTRATVTLGGIGGTRIANVAAGAVSAVSRDAVNGAQLFTLATGTASALGGGASVKADGSLSHPSYVIGGSTYDDVGHALKAVESAATAAAADSVQYDSPSHTRVTLGGATNGTVLSNVAAGSADRDAVNVAQLKGAGLKIDNSGNLTNSFVAYDDLTKSGVTLGGKNGTAIHNVAAGSATNDAVNAGQLRAVAAALGGGATLSATGALVSPTYHMVGGTQTTVGGALDALNTGLSSISNEIANSGIHLIAQDAKSRVITIGGETDGRSVSVAGLAGNRTLTGVAAGSVSKTSVDAVNGGQLFATSQSVASALGGGAKVNADGTVSAPTYSVGGTTVTNVGSAISNLDGRVTQNTQAIADLTNTVGDIAGTVANGVQYDSDAHDKVTLGGTSASETVALTNVSDAALNATSSDAVTGAQLYTTNEQVASLDQAIQNVAVESRKYLAVNSPNGAASAQGDTSLAVGAGASAIGVASTALGDLASATGANSVALGANSVADRDNTVSLGSIGNERQLTNVAAGTAPTDAVNLGQLGSAMGSMGRQIDDVDRSARRGIAAASALNIVTPYLPGRTTLNAGVAAYRGQAALGLGVSRWNQKGTVNYNLGVSSAGGNSTIVRAGVGIVFRG